MNNYVCTTVNDTPTGIGIARAQETFMHHDYPVTFFISGQWLRWFVTSRYPDGVVRPVAGPFRRRITAERLKIEFVREYRNGFDMGYNTTSSDEPTPIKSGRR